MPHTTLSRRSFIVSAAGLALGAALCSAAGAPATALRSALADEAPKTVTIISKDANGEDGEHEVPFDPQRIAILDMACLDILDRLGLGDRVVGMADTSIDYLQDYATNKDLEALGTIKEADLEAVMKCEPDIIFIGGRLSSSYDILSEIAPVVYLATDVEKGLVQSVNDNATTIASIFGLEDKIAEEMAGFGERIDALREVAQGQTAVVGMCTSGSFNVLGNDGRCSIIGREVGFDNVAAGEASSNERSGGQGGQGGSGERGGDRGGQGAEGHGGSGDQAQGERGGQAVAAVTATHGNESSFETIVSLDPDYIFVMDRDAAIGTEGAQLAQEIMENELVESMRAYQDGHIVYLEHPAVWYTAEGGITALDYMLADLEKGLGLSE